MKQFEKLQELDIFQGTMESLQRTISKSPKTINSADENDVKEYRKNLSDLTEEEQNLLIPIVQNSIEFIACGYGHTVEKWSWKDKDTVLRNIHTALFYHALKSLNLQSKDLENYFDSLQNLFVPFDFRFYKKILIRCSFSHYFVECLLQLPENVAIKVLQNISMDSDNLCKDVSLAFDCCKHFLRVSVIGIQNFAVPQFNFSFEDDTENHEDVVTKPSSVENAICGLLGLGSDSIHDPFILGMSLQWLLDILEILLDVLRGDEPFSCINDIKPYFEYVKEQSMSPIVLEFLAKSLKSYKNDDFRNSLESGNRFEEYIGYTLFYLFAVYQDLCRALKKTEFNHYGDIVLLIEDVVKNLFCYHPLWSKDDKVVLGEYTEMLLFLVEAKLPARRFACQVLLDKEFPVAKNRVFDCVKKDPSSISYDFCCMESLLDAAIDMGPEAEECHKVFFEAYESIPPRNQLCLLRLKVNKYGASQQLKLSTFDSCLLQFCKRTTNLEQVNFAIASLCIQSMEETVQRIISEFVNHGSTRLPIVQGLAVIDFVCCYSEDENSPSLLVKILQPHFVNGSLETTADKNLKQLLHILLKDLASNGAFSMEQFFKLCILPNFDLPFTRTRIKSTLEVLNSVMDFSQRNNCSDWLQHIHVSALIGCLCALIEFSVMNIDGHLKEMAVQALNCVSSLVQTSDILLSNMESHRGWLKDHLSSMQLSIGFYVWDYVQTEDIDRSSLDFQDLILWFVIRNEKDSDAMKKALTSHSQYRSTVSIITVLTQVIPHFTTMEFMQLAKVLESLSRDTYDASTVSLIDNSFNTELVYKKLHAIFVCDVLVDVFILLSKHNGVPLDWTFMLSCFSKLTTEILRSVGMCAYTRCKVLLHVCRLAGHIKKHFNVLSIILSDILKSLKTCDFRVLDTCKDYISAAENLLKESVREFNMTHLLN